MSTVSAVEAEMARLAGSLPDGVAKLSVEPGDTARSKNLMLGHRYSDLPYLDEIRALCLAPIRCEVEETVWFKGDEVVGGTAKARIGSRGSGDAWRQVFTNPLRGRTKNSFTYEPYV